MKTLVGVVDKKWQTLNSMWSDELKTQSGRMKFRLKTPIQPMHHRSLYQATPQGP